MTEQELRAMDEAWEYLQILPRRHAKELLDAQYDWNKKTRDCNHLSPNGRSGVTGHFCYICRRNVEPTS